MVNAEYFVKRIGQAIITIFGVVTLTFALIRLTPGGPEAVITARIMQQNPGIRPRELERRVSLYVSYIPDDPMWKQYIDYITSLAMGDLGLSIRYGRSVADIMAQALPWTLFVMSFAIITSSVISILIGALMAYKEGSRFDVAMTGWTILVTSVPYYVFAIIFIYLLGFQWSVFPTGGRMPNGVDVSLSLDFIFGALYHGALPILSLVLPGIVGGLSMRGNSIQVLGSDYMRVARLRGLSDRVLIFRYTLWNAVLPIYTGLMISIGFMFGGSIILETIFAYPGIGYYMLEGVEARDYTLMMGGFLLITIAVIVSIMIADFTYGMIDPRAKAGSREAYVGSGGILNRRALRKFVRAVKVNVTGSVGDGDETNGQSQSETDSDRQTTANGGQLTETSVFGTTSDITMTRGDQFRHSLDSWVLTPLRIIWSDWRTRIGFSLLAIYVFAGTIGVHLVSYPGVMDAPILEVPFQSMEYPLGTDGQGRPLGAQLIHATPDMLKMIASGAVFATVVGTLVGTLAGYSGGSVDTVLSTIMDMVLTIPGLPLIVVLAAIIQPEDPFLVGFILTVNAWAGLARSVRSQVLTLREESYVEASRVIGSSTRGIIGSDILPNIGPYIMVNFANSARGVIFASVGLYFLGILPFTSFNWGVMMNFAYTSGGSLYTLSTAHWLFFPMFAIIGLSLAFILIAQGMDRLFNPRIRARHAEMIRDSGDTDQGDEGSTGGTLHINQ